MMSLFRKTLSEELYIYADKHGLNFIIYEYSDGMELLAADMSFDLIFMDHQMTDKKRTRYRFGIEETQC